jgi:putative aminopeptidase FrvX
LTLGLTFPNFEVSPADTIRRKCVDKTELLLKELTEASGAPGREEEVSSLMEKRLKPHGKVSYDKLGSIIAEKQGSASQPRVMIAGHLDEVAFMVTEITKEGYLRFLPLGGWWGHVALAQRVRIITRKGLVRGVVGSKAPHVLPPEERRKVLEIDQLFIDVGCQEKFDVKKRLGIEVGDVIIPEAGFEIMGNQDMYLAKAFDNRIACAAVIDILTGLGKGGHPNTVYGVATVQEEVGLRGAGTAAYQIDPDVAIALDVTVARDTPGMSPGETVGKGPVIIVYDGSHIPNFKLRTLVQETAAKIKVPVQFGSLERGGTDAGRIHMSRRGVPVMALGIATRYIHSHAAMLSRRDYDHWVKLMVAVIRRLDAKTVKGLTRG